MVDLKGKNVWQVSAGNTNRNYANLCVKRDVILDGPGDAGKWPECQDELQNTWGVSPQKLNDIKRFAEEVKHGDYVVLRMGTTDVCAFGQVDGEYQWLEEFGDIDGWDVQHVRRVRWLWSNCENPKRFKSYTLKWGDTVQVLSSQEVFDWLSELSIEQSEWNRPLAELPAKSKGVEWDTITNYLFDQGIGSNDINNLTQQIDELIRVSKWYQRTTAPSESETVAYLAIPLLRALGWTPQKMAIEWNKVDIALFNTLPRDPKNLSVVVEVKQKGLSCLTAHSQARSYAEATGGHNCKRLIVTDGVRYGVYLSEDGFSNTPHAYLNLTRMRKDYPVIECKGAKDAFLLMSADWMPED